jgi:hypothetical protein
VYGKFNYFYFKKCREIIKKIFLFFHFLKMSFAKLRVSPPKKREKTTASHESSPFWFFFITQNCQKQRCWVRVTGAPPACIRSKQELWTRRSWRVLRHTTRPVSASIRHRQTSARALFFTPSLLTFSRSLPPFVSSFVSRGMEPPSEEAEEEEEEAPEEEAW